jgi:hypothetical protein
MRWPIASDCHAGMDIALDQTCPSMDRAIAKNVSTTTDPGPRMVVLFRPVVAFTVGTRSA